MNWVELLPFRNTYRETKDWRLFKHKCFVQGYWQWQSLYSCKLFFKACFPVIEMCSFFSCSPASSRYFRSSTSWSYFIWSSCPSGVVWLSIKAVPCGVYTSGFLSITSFSACSVILVKKYHVTLSFCVLCDYIKQCI